MKNANPLLLVALLALCPIPAGAQVAVAAHANQDQLIASTDAKLARNKKLVYDFWREIVDAGNIDQIDKYVAENYIQHNPNIATGRKALVMQIAKNVPHQAVQARVKAPLVSMIAEGNMVVVSMVCEIPDPKDPTKKYTTTWFDMFRIEDGKIAEHWDSAAKVN